MRSVFHAGAQKLGCETSEVDGWRLCARMHKTSRLGFGRDARYGPANMARLKVSAMGEIARTRGAPAGLRSDGSG